MAVCNYNPEIVDKVLSTIKSLATPKTGDDVALLISKSDLNKVLVQNNIPIEDFSKFVLEAINNTGDTSDLTRAILKEYNNAVINEMNRLKSILIATGSSIDIDKLPAKVRPAFSFNKKLLEGFLNPKVDLGKKNLERIKNNLNEVKTSNRSIASKKNKVGHYFRGNTLLRAYYNNRRAGLASVLPFNDASFNYFISNILPFGVVNEVLNELSQIGVNTGVAFSSGYAMFLSNSELLSPKLNELYREIDSTIFGFNSESIIDSTTEFLAKVEEYIEDAIKYTDTLIDNYSNFKSNFVITLKVPQGFTENQIVTAYSTVVDFISKEKMSGREPVKESLEKYITNVLSTTQDTQTKEIGKLLLAPNVIDTILDDIKLKIDEFIESDEASTDTNKEDEENDTLFKPFEDSSSRINNYNDIRDELKFLLTSTRSYLSYDKDGNIKDVSLVPHTRTALDLFEETNSNQSSVVKYINYVFLTNELHTLYESYVNTENRKSTRAFAERVGQYLASFTPKQRNTQLYIDLKMFYDKFYSLDNPSSFFSLALNESTSPSIREYSIDVLRGLFSKYSSATRTPFTVISKETDLEMTTLSSRERQPEKSSSTVGRIFRELILVSNSALFGNSNIKKGTTNIALFNSLNNVVNDSALLDSAKISRIFELLDWKKLNNRRFIDYITDEKVARTGNTIGFDILKYFGERFAKKQSLEEEQSTLTALTEAYMRFYGVRNNLVYKNAEGSPVYIINRRNWFKKVLVDFNNHKKGIKTKTSKKFKDIMAKAQLLELRVFSGFEDFKTFKGTDYGKLRSADLNKILFEDLFYNKRENKTFGETTQSIYVPAPVLSDSPNMVMGRFKYIVPNAFETEIKERIAEELARIKESDNKVGKYKNYHDGAKMGKRMLIPALVEKQQQFSFDRYSENNYEVSTAGDKRFSAFNAKLKDGRTIEEAYQLDLKGYRSRGFTSPLQAKGMPSLNHADQIMLYQDYKALWKQWSIENPALLEELRKNAFGKVLTDKFANSKISQARALSEILNETAFVDSQIYFYTAEDIALMSNPVEEIYKGVQRFLENEVNKFVQTNSENDQKDSLLERYLRYSGNDSSGFLLDATSMFQNYLVYQYDLTKLFMGDVATKGFADLSKRLKLLVSPHVIHLDDVELELAGKKYLGEKTGYAISIDPKVEFARSEIWTGVKSSYNPSDGGSLYSLEALRRKSNSYGNTLGTEVNIAEKEVSIGTNNDDIQVYVKHGGYYVTEEIARRFPLIAEKNKILEEKGLTAFVPDSAVKTGLPVELSDDLKNPTIIEVDSQNAGSQTNVSSKIEDPKKLGLLSQLMYHIGYIVTDNPVTMKEHQDFVQEIYDNLSKAIDYKLNKVIRRISSRPELSRLIKATLKRSGKQSMLGLAIEADVDYLNLPTTSSELIKMISSIMKTEVIRLGLKGQKYHLVSSPDAKLHRITREVGGLNVKLSITEDKLLEQEVNRSDKEDTYTQLQFAPITVEYNGQIMSDIEANKLALRDGVDFKSSARVVGIGSSEVIGNRQSKKNIIELLSKPTTDSRSSNFIANNFWYYGVVDQPGSEEHDRIVAFSRNTPESTEVGYRVLGPNESVKFKELVQGVGVRIPTTGKHNAIAAQFVDFLDSDTNILFYPPDMMAIHGSDNDGDSIFMMDWYDVTEKSKLELEKLNKQINELEQENFEIYKVIKTLPANSVETSTLDSKVMDNINLMNKLVQKKEKLQEKLRDDDFKIAMDQVHRRLISLVKGEHLSNKLPIVEEMMYPISLEPYKKVVDNFLEYYKLPQFNENNVFNPNAQIEQFKKNIESGKNLVGYMANTLKLFSYLSRYNDITFFNIDGQERTLASLQGKDIKGNRAIWSVIDTLTNSLVDAVKETIAPKILLNSQTKAIWATSIMIGNTFEQTMALIYAKNSSGINSPAKDLVSLTRDPRFRPFINSNKDLNKYFYSAFKGKGNLTTLSKIVSLQNADKFLDATLRAKSNYESISDKDFPNVVIGMLYAQAYTSYLTNLSSELQQIRDTLSATASFTYNPSKIMTNAINSSVPIESHYFHQIRSYKELVQAMRTVGMTRFSQNYKAIIDKVSWSLLPNFDPNSDPSIERKFYNDFTRFKLLGVIGRVSYYNLDLSDSSNFDKFKSEFIEEFKVVKSTLESFNPEAFDRFLIVKDEEGKNQIRIESGPNEVFTNVDIQLLQSNFLNALRNSGLDPIYIEQFIDKAIIYNLLQEGLNFSSKSFSHVIPFEYYLGDNISKINYVAELSKDNLSSEQLKMFGIQFLLNNLELTIDSKKVKSELTYLVFKQSVDNEESKQDFVVINEHLFVDINSPYLKKFNGTFYDFASNDIATLVGLQKRTPAALEADRVKDQLINSEEIIDEFGQQQLSPLAMAVNQATLISISESLSQRMGNLPVVFVNDPDEDFLGKVIDGNVVINTAKATLDTPFHEFSHIVISDIKLNNPALYQRLVESAKQEPDYNDLLNLVSSLYPENEVEEEILAYYSGKFGAEAFQNKSNSSLSKRIVTAFNEVIGAIKNLLGIYVTSYNLNPNTTIRELASIIAGNRKFRNQSINTLLTRMQRISIYDGFKKFKNTAVEAQIQSAINIGRKTVTIEDSTYSVQDTDLVEAKLNEVTENRINNTYNIITSILNGTIPADQERFVTPLQDILGHFVGIDKDLTDIVEINTVDTVGDKYIGSHLVVKHQVSSKPGGSDYTIIRMVPPSRYKKERILEGKDIRKFTANLVKGLKLTNSGADEAKLTSTLLASELLKDPNTVVRNAAVIHDVGNAVNADYVDFKLMIDNMEAIDSKLNLTSQGFNLSTLSLDRFEKNPARILGLLYPSEFKEFSDDIANIPDSTRQTMINTLKESIVELQQSKKKASSEELKIIDSRLRLAAETLEQLTNDLETSDYRAINQIERFVKTTKEIYDPISQWVANEFDKVIYRFSIGVNRGVQDYIPIFKKLAESKKGSGRSRLDIQDNTTVLFGNLHHTNENGLKTGMLVVNPYIVGEDGSQILDRSLPSNMQELWDNLSKEEKEFSDFYSKRIKEMIVGSFDTTKQGEWWYKKFWNRAMLPLIYANEAIKISQEGFTATKAKEYFNNLRKGKNDPNEILYEANSDTWLTDLVIPVKALGASLTGDSVTNNPERHELINSQSYNLDLTEIYNYLLAQSERKKSMTDVIPYYVAGMELLRLKGSKFDTNLQALKDSFIVNILGGKDNFKLDIAGFFTITNRTINDVRSLTTMASLGFNITSQYREVLYGFINHYKTIAASTIAKYKRIYDLNTLLKAESIVSSSIFDEEGKARLFLSKYQLYGTADFNYTMFKQMTDQRFLTEKNALLVYTYNDLYRSAIHAIAYAIHDGVWDAHEVVNGELVYNQDKDTRSDAVKRIVYKNNVENKIENQDEGSMSYAYDASNVSFIKEVYYDMFGNYDPLKAAPYERRPLLSLVAQLRKYMPRTILRVFQPRALKSSQYVLDKDGNKVPEAVEGIYNTLEYLVNYMRDIRKLSLEGAVIDDVRRRNIATLATDLVSLSMAITAAMIISAFDDDSDEEWRKVAIWQLRIINRIFMDSLGGYNYQEIFNVINDPIISAKIALDVAAIPVNLVKGRLDLVEKALWRATPFNPLIGDITDVATEISRR